jgi:hypothetical protein
MNRALCGGGTSEIRLGILLLVREYTSDNFLKIVARFAKEDMQGERGLYHNGERYWRCMLDVTSRCIDDVHGFTLIPSPLI